MDSYFMFMLHSFKFVNAFLFGTRAIVDGGVASMYLIMFQTHLVGFGFYTQPNPDVVMRKCKKE